MASTINGTSTGSGGLISTGDDSGILNIQTNETTAITVDASQRVGVGTTSPQRKVSIVGTDGASGQTEGNSRTSLFLDNNGANYLSIFTSTSGDGGVFFSDNGQNNGGMVYETSSDALYFRANNAERARIDSSGNLLVGTTSASGNEKFNATTSSDKVALFYQSANTNAYNGIHVVIGSSQSNTSSYHFRGETRGFANYYLYGNGTTSYSSDIRLKKNVQTARGYLEDLNKLRVVKYQWKGEDPDCQQVELGLIAQEVEEVFPNLIQEHEVEGVGDIKNIKQSVLPFMMLKAIQELKAINDTQAETINALTARIVALEGQ